MTPVLFDSAVGFTHLEVEVPALWNQSPSGQLRVDTRNCSVTLVISSIGLELVHKNDGHSGRTNSALKNTEIHSIVAPRVGHVHCYTRGTQVSSFSEKEK